LENDANAGAVAEHRFGAGRGARNMVFLTMGTGLGAGIIADGRLYRGTCDAAGEIGHVRLTPRGPVGYHKAGSVEGWASGGGLGRIATKVLGQGREFSARDVAEAARAGDERARKLIRSTGRRLGEALAILIDILNPERIVIGGLAMRLGEDLLKPARAILRREALSASAAACEIVPAALDEQIGDLAALCVALEASVERKPALDEALQVFQSLPALDHVLETASRLCTDALRANRKLLICGNGGSAAEAQHLAGELMGRYKNNRPALPAIALTADSALVTCIGNDGRFGLSDLHR
jgi:predicted NBD/HSP70 family sugar kinase